MSSLTDLFNRLEVYSKTDSHRQVYDTAKFILEKDATNINALKRCLVALINMDNYADAKKLIARYTNLVEAETPAIVLELAYIFYKLNLPEEKLFHLKNFISADQELPFNHILAQYYYRVGKDSKSLTIYQDLIGKNENESEYLDLSVNERAVISQLKFQNTFKYNSTNTAPISKTMDDSYDQLFNDSLILIINKDYERALDSLDRTLKLAESSLSNSDYENDEKFLELAPIRLQIVYVLILTLKFDSALGLLNDLDTQLLSLQTGTSDINSKILKLLIDNNKLVCKKYLDPTIEFNPTLLYRELDLPNILSLSNEKLTLPQLSVLERNHLLLSNFAGKNSKNLIKKFNKTFPNSLLLNSLTDINEKNIFKKSISQPSNVALALLSSQIAINANNYQRAISIIENIVEFNEELLLLPSVGKILYSLYEVIDCKNKILTLLTKIQTVLVAKDLSEFNNNDIDYSIFIALKLLSFNEKLAKDLLIKINRLDLLETKYSEKDVEDLVSGIDIDVLISQNIDPLINSSNSTSNANVHKVKAKRLRSKPKRLPKNISQQIDPERWLPLKDRSYYKMKKSKKLKNTQGGVIDADTEKSLNLSNQTPEATPVSTTSGNSNSKKSKKKKGKK